MSACLWCDATPSSLFDLLQLEKQQQEQQRREEEEEELRRCQREGNQPLGERLTLDL